MNDPTFIVEKDWRRDDEFPGCQIVKVGDLLFLSGIVAVDEDGKIVGNGDLQAQARQIFTNMRRVLGLVGCDLTSVVRLTTYIATSLAEPAVTHRYWDVRREFFGNHRPATTGVQVAGLASPDMLIEVDAIAYAPNAAVGPDARIVNVK